MDIDTLLRDTFSAHEYLAPREDEISAAVHQRLAQHRSALARPLAVAATVAVVAGAAGGAVVVADQRHSDRVSTAAGSTSPALSTASSASTARATATRSGPAARTGTAIAPLVMPFTLGWLPAGAATYTSRQIKIGGDDSTRPFFDGEYMLAVTGADGQTLEIDAQQMPFALSDARIRHAPSTSVTVNGRPGIEGVGPGGYETYFVDSAGGLVDVNVGAQAGSTIADAELADVGRQIARGIVVPGSTQVAPTFGLGYRPAGLQVTAFSVQTGTLAHPTTPGASGPGESTSYSLGSPNSVETPLTVTDTALPIAAVGTSGRAVQGHATSYTVEDGVTYLRIVDAVGRYPVWITSSLPQSEIYRVADGLVLPH